MARRDGRKARLVAHDGGDANAVKVPFAVRASVSTFLQVVRFFAFLLASMLLVLETAIHIVPSIGTALYAESGGMAAGTYLDAIVWFIVPVSFVVLVLAFAEFSVLRHLWRRTGDATLWLQGRLFAWYDARTGARRESVGKVRSRKARRAGIDDEAASAV